MSRLPDRFDLWVRRAKASEGQARQVDYVLGALVTLEEWFFLNIGTQNEPLPAISEVEGVRYLLLFTDADRVAELGGQIGMDDTEPPVIAIAADHALAWCVNERPMQCEGVLINPGADAVAVSLDQMAKFAAEWKARDVQAGSGFWIPNLSTEEEEFWQEHGL